MRIGIGQIDMGFENKERAKIVCRETIQKAKEANVDLLIFPEMTLTGFTLSPEIYGESLEDSGSLRFFQKEAKKNGLYIAFGLAVTVGDNAENHCIIVSPNGDMIADYAKIHPFSYSTENEHYEGGTEMVRCEICGVSVTPFICYDLRFPEIFQAASSQSTLIFLIANWPASRRAHWITLLQARAIENQCFIVGVNRTGMGGKISYSGDSMVISPYGEILARLCSDTNFIAVDIETMEADRYRQEFPVKQDRKVEIYHHLY